MKFQRRSANHFSFLNSYTFGRAIDLNSDNDGTVTLTNIFDPEYNRGPADYDVTHTFSSNWIYELPWARERTVGRLAGQRHPRISRSGLPLHDHAVAEHAVDRHHQQPAEPDLRPARCRNPTIDLWFNTACFQQVADTTGTFGNTGRNTFAGRAVQHRLSLIKNTKFGHVSSELRLEVFNLLNHPQFANPNGQFGNAAFGTISSMSRARRARSAARPNGRSSSR